MKRPCIDTFCHFEPGNPPRLCCVSSHEVQKEHKEAASHCSQSATEIYNIRPSRLNKCSITNLNPSLVERMCISYGICNSGSKCCALKYKLELEYKHAAAFCMKYFGVGTVDGWNACTGVIVNGVVVKDSAEVPWQVLIANRNDREYGGYLKLYFKLNIIIHSVDVGNNLLHKIKFLRYQSII